MYQQKVSVDERGIKRVFGPISVDSVNEGLSDSKNWAQLRQTVTTIYPSARGSDSLSDALFEDNAFGDGLEFESERVAFAPVPPGTTEADVKAKLNRLAEPKLVRYLSLDIEKLLTDEQKRAMQTGLSKDSDGNLITLEYYKETRHIRNSETGEKVQFRAPDGSFHPQYGISKFRSTFVEDVDLRNDDWAEMYPERLEIVNAAQEQSQTA